MAGSNAVMTPQERLTATLTGQPVDRPPVSLYEIDGLGILRAYISHYFL